MDLTNVGDDRRQTNILGSISEYGTLSARVNMPLAEISGITSGREKTPAPPDTVGYDIIAKTNSSG